MLLIGLTSHLEADYFVDFFDQISKSKRIPDKEISSYFPPGLKSESECLKMSTQEVSSYFPPRIS
jgi:hypothetical protein